MENGVAIEFKQAIQFHAQGQFHPLKYITALADELTRIIGHISEQTFTREVNLKIKSMSPTR